MPAPHSPYLLGAPFASWGRRVAAYLIDAVALLLLWGLPVAGSWLGFYLAFEDATAETLSAISLWVVAVVVMGLYYPLTMGRRGARNGQTWGKQAMGVRVVRNSGEPMTGGLALVREVLVKNLLLGVCGIVQLVDFLWPLWDDLRQSLHDKIVSTFVVRA